MAIECPEVAVFSGGVYTGAVFGAAVLIGAGFADAVFSGATPRGAVFTGAVKWCWLRQCTLQWGSL